MPIKIPNDLPACKILNDENVFIMQETRAITQDIRPLKIAILNLMPKKIETETQLLRMVGNTPLQVEIELLQTATYTSKNTSQEHLLKFYKTFDDVKDQKFDGLIVTGAPVELMEFEDVNYWDELCRIMEWTKTNVFSTFHICWGAQAGLYYHYGIRKYPMDAKVSGVFVHRVLDPDHYLMYGFDEMFYAPHSRHTEVRGEDIAAVPELQVLSASDRAGVYVIASRDGKHFFVTGHSEYDRDTLAVEYLRDRNAGLEIAMPENYFPGNDPGNPPMIRWRSHANLLYSNWLNYFVYQLTPYDFTEVK